MTFPGRAADTQAPPPGRSEAEGMRKGKCRRTVNSGHPNGALQIPPRHAPRRAGASGTGPLRSEAVTFLILRRVCGRKALDSIYQHASPGSFDSAQQSLLYAINLRGASLRRKTFPRRVRRTAGPSAPLRSGRDDKGGEEVFHSKLVAGGANCRSLPTASLQSG